MLLIALGAVWSASVAFEFECDKSSAFLPNPSAHKRVGYVTDLNGFGVTLPKDLQVSLPFKPSYPQLGATQGVAGGPITAKVVGVIENFTWAGGVTDAITFQFDVSQANATALKAVASSMPTTSVQSIGWWIGDYDEETKAWFEAAKPSSSPTLKAVIQGSLTQPALSAPAVGSVNVYKVSIKIVPQAHQSSTLSFANSSTQKVTKIWGLP